MIHFFEGSVFNAPAAVITNTVNCTGVMGAGLALEVGLRHPDLQADYERRCRQGQVRLGHPYLFPLQEAAPYQAVLNFPTKKHWRFPSQLTWIEQGLAYIARHHANPARPITSLALPRLGCDRGGLDWAVVEPLIHQHLGDLSDLEVFLCADAAPAAGVEAAMLQALASDLQAGPLPAGIPSRAGRALQASGTPDRFRQLTRVPGLGKTSYACLFRQYYRLAVEQQSERSGQQLSLLETAGALAESAPTTRNNRRSSPRQP